MNNYREMKYYPYPRTIMLDSGLCYNYKYYIMNLGTHPTAYVQIPFDHPYYGKSYDDIDIDVHGGLTYSEDYLNLENEKITNCWFIGWDYAHCGDYLGFWLNYSSEFTHSHKWTTKEIREDVMKVCRQLKDIENKEKYSKKEE